MRAVLDTNVLVSGLLWRGTPRTVLTAAFSDLFTLLASEALLLELESVLVRAKFGKDLIRIRRTSDESVLLIRQAADLVIPVAVPPDAIRDPKDRMILECAVGGQANFIVSSDQDLLVLGAYAGIPIITPKTFSDRL